MNVAGDVSVNNGEGIDQVTDYQFLKNVPSLCNVVEYWADVCTLLVMQTVEMIHKF